jgi:hypothetical protein
MVAALPNDGRMVACHWRMRTHGNIDLDNCHPYPVNTTTALMHNGILHTGNKADTTKSDTHHFIKDYLTGVGDNALHDPGMLKMLGDFIEGNRFAIMSADGRLSVVNKDQGVESHGLWFSNTYAWEPEILMPEYGRRKARGVYYPQKWDTKGYDLDDAMEGLGAAWGSGYSKDTNPFDADYEAEDDPWLDSLDEIDEMIQEALEECSPTLLACALRGSPEYTITTILKALDITPVATPTNLTGMSRTMVQDWVDGAEHELRQWCVRQSDKLAEALIYHCNFESKQPTTV